MYRRLEKVARSDAFRYDIYMEYKFFQEIKFYQDKQTGYWITSKCPKKRMHVVVWEAFNGKVPKGQHIHHLDENKSNNDISNLTLLSRSEHAKKHWTKERNEWGRKQVRKMQQLAKAWHGTEEGIEWHKEHGIDCWVKRKVVILKCEACGKEFTTKQYWQKFCSNNCKSAFRRKSNVDSIEVECEFCKKYFKKNKYSKAICCSKSCGCKMSWKTSKKRQIYRKV